MKRSNRTAVGVLGVGAVGVVTAVALILVSKTPTGCGELDGEAVTTPVEHVLVIELQGNTDSQQADAESFLRERLAEVSSDEPTPLQVKIQLIRYGEVLTPQTECLKKPLVLQGSPEDIETLLKGSTAEGTKEQIKGDLADQRETQIGWVVDALVGEIAATSFDGLDSAAPVWSPLYVWSAARASAPSATGSVSVLSPMVSTEDDCLKDAGSDGAAAIQAVRDCLRFDQLAPLEVAASSVTVTDSGATEPDRQAAETLRAALCAEATSDNCSADQPTDTATPSVTDE